MGGNKIKRNVKKFQERTCSRNFKRRKMKDRKKVSVKIKRMTSGVKTERPELQRGLEMQDHKMRNIKEIINYVRTCYNAFKIQI